MTGFIVCTELSFFSLKQTPPGQSGSLCNMEDIEEKTERDTEASEDCPVELLPDGKFPVGVDLFSISVRNSALRGWVKQPSPCCAAASVAGCFNTLRGIERSNTDSGALCAADVIRAMDEQVCIANQLNTAPLRADPAARVSESTVIRGWCMQFLAFRTD